MRAQMETALIIARQVMLAYPRGGHLGHGQHDCAHCAPSALQRLRVEGLARVVAVLGTCTVTVSVGGVSMRLSL